MDAHAVWLARYNANPHLANTAAVAVTSVLFSALAVTCPVSVASINRWAAFLWAGLAEALLYALLDWLIHRRWQPRHPSWLTAALDYCYEPPPSWFLGSGVNPRPRLSKWFVTGPNTVVYYLWETHALDSHVLASTTLIIIICAYTLSWVQ